MGPTESLAFESVLAIVLLLRPNLTSHTISYPKYWALPVSNSVVVAEGSVGTRYLGFYMVDILSQNMRARGPCGLDPSIDHPSPAH
jgi:hypothetical protein